MDGALAWDIAKWSTDQDARTDDVVLTQSQIESLATYLSEKGWGAKHRDVSVGDLKGLVTKARKFADEILGEPERASGKPADR